MAGGVGRRAGDELPKQFHKLLGIPMLWWSVKAFYEEDPNTEITIVMHPDFHDLYHKLLTELPESIQKIDVKICSGGQTRGESVSNGLKSIDEPSVSLIAIHDAARPIIDIEMIRRGWESARRHKAAIPVVPVTDSLREKSGEGSIAVDRNRFYAVQTPQIFGLKFLKQAYQEAINFEFTDDASLVEAQGSKVHLYEGSPVNIKVTNPMDFKIAETLLAEKSIK